MVRGCGGSCYHLVSVETTGATTGEEQPPMRQLAPQLR